MCYYESAPCAVLSSAVSSQYHYHFMESIYSLMISIIYSTATYYLTGSKFAFQVTVSSSLFNHLYCSLVYTCLCFLTKLCFKVWLVTFFIFLIDGVANDEEYIRVYLSLFVIYTVLSIFGIIFAVICLIFNLWFRKQKYDIERLFYYIVHQCI